MREESYFIGLDDTDNEESIGTGAFARELVIYLARHLSTEHLGTTRHQFLIHPDIPYTSHNSSACVKVFCNQGEEALVASCREFMGLLVHQGADPGLCVCSRSQLTDAMVSFGRRAQTEIVTKVEAIELGREAGVLLEEHGGEGIGIIGALAGAALRMHGNDGRFIGHRGLRHTPELMSVAELLELTAVEMVVDEKGALLDADQVVETNNWVRPNLVEGRIILDVRRHPETGTLQVIKQKKR